MPAIALPVSHTLRRTSEGNTMNVDKIDRRAFIARLGDEPVLAIVPEGVDLAKRGERVTVQMLDWPESVE